VVHVIHFCSFFSGVGGGIRGFLFVVVVIVLVAIAHLTLLL